MYLATRLAGIGYGAVCLLPQFEEVNGVWEPMADAVIRKVNNPKDPNASMMRYGTLVKVAGKPVARYTNEFMSQQQLAIMLVMENLSAGSVVDGKLVIEESLVPFSKTNPARDLKKTPDGITCKVDDAPIYRRTVFTNDMSKVDVTITHTNGEELSKAASLRFNGPTNSQAMKDAAAKNLLGSTPALDTAAIEARIDELETIPEANRTTKQKKELAALLLQVV